jgi:UDP-N-acetylmuramyl pentapeptide synthase
MELRELLAGADVIEIKGDPRTEITGLAYDSRRALPGTLFFAYPGSTVDGHAFAAAAADAGAVAVVC